MPVIKLDSTNTKIQDTYVVSSSPTAINDATNTLIVGKSGTATNIIFLKFNPGLIPNNAIINSATLSLATSGAYNPITINVHNVLADFDTTTMTWDNKPSYDSVIDATLINPSNASTFSTDITETIKKILNGDGYGIALEASSSTSTVAIYATEYATIANRPTITIDYTIPTTDKKQVEFIGYQNISGAVPLTLPTPSMAKIGDVVVAYAYSGAPVSTTPPNGWTTLAINEGGTQNQGYSSIFYRRITGDEQLAQINGTVFLAVYMQVYRNVKTVASYGPPVQANSTSVFSSGPLSGLPVNSLIAFYLGSNYTNDYRQPVNVTEYYDTGNGVGVFGTYNYQVTSFPAFNFSNGGTNSNVATKTIVLTPILNEAPHIDGTDEYLGSLSTALSKSYTVTDTEGDTITVTEKLNGNTIRTYQGSGAQTLDLSAQWASLPVGKHTVTIEANDDYANPPHTPTVRTWTFLKILPNTATLVESVQGLQQVVPYLEDLKSKLITKLGGNPGDRFEDLLANNNTSIRARGDASISDSVNRYYLKVRQTSGTPATALFYKLIISGFPFRPSFIIYTYGDTTYIADFDGLLYGYLSPSFMVSSMQNVMEDYQNSFPMIQESDGTFTIQLPSPTAYSGVFEWRAYNL